MAHSYLNLYNPNSTKAKLAPVGFSWTAAIFSNVTPLFRCDGRGFLKLLLIVFAGALVINGIMFLYVVLLSLLPSYSTMLLLPNELILSLTSFFLYLSLMYFIGLKYNKMYIKHLIKLGFQVVNHTTVELVGFEVNLDMKLPVLEEQIDRFTFMVRTERRKCRLIGVGLVIGVPIGIFAILSLLG